VQPVQVFQYFVCLDRTNCNNGSWIDWFQVKFTSSERNETKESVLQLSDGWSSSPTQLCIGPFLELILFAVVTCCASFRGIGT
jgi:hypothetical protein